MAEGLPLRHRLKVPPCGWHPAAGNDDGNQAA
jgi:hypothetical protein